MRNISLLKKYYEDNNEIPPYIAFGFCGIYIVHAGNETAGK